jgi:hypothetical protein
MLSQLLEYINQIEALVNSEADWRYKYGRVFKLHSQFIYPLLQELAIKIDMPELNDEYEYDVRSYMIALSDVKQNVEIELEIL